MRTTTALTLVALAVAFAGACSRPQSAPPASAAPAAAGAAVAAHPVAAGSTAREAAPPAVGPVLEVIHAAAYTYVRVNTESGEVWAVAPRTDVKVGDRVVVPRDMPAPNYHSPSLNRDFALLYFAASLTQGGETPGAPTASPHGGPTVSPADAAMPAPGSIRPAEGGSTVAAVWADSKTLDGRTVTVRGKVVRFNGGILGRNWLHLQDGTGKPEDGTHDLTVTTDAVAKVGDVVTITGKVSLNKDFGAGYAYRVIVEGATVAVK